MKRTILFILSVLMLGAGVSCQKMNSTHDKYLKNGPIIYIGKLDSLHVFCGNKRVALEYWTTDPRIKQACFYWNNKKDSLNVTVPSHDPTDMLTAEINPIAEGEIVFQVFTYDGKGHRSIKFEKTVTTYGDRYISSLMTRGVRTATVSGDKLTLTWGGSGSSQDIGSEVCYTSSDGEEKTVFFSIDELASATSITGVDVTKPVTYYSCYKPDITCLDVFHSAARTLAL